MTIGKQLLINIYTNQKFFQTRILEMLCAISEEAFRTWIKNSIENSTTGEEEK
jgi:hypothetical protein